MAGKTYIIFILALLFAVLPGFTVRPKIARIADRLAKAPSLHLGLPVGFSAVPETNNKYYKLFLKLQRSATDTELVVLTKNPSKNIVVYAFIALSARNYDGLKEIFLEHLYDSSSFWIATGCTGSFHRVNSFMLSSLRPNQPGGNKDQLTEQEYQDYLRLIRK